MSNLLLSYLRHFPFDYGKSSLAKKVRVPVDPAFDFTTPLGVRMTLDLREYQMKQIYLHGWYEKNTIRHLLKHLRADWTFVDVGANVGFYSFTIGKGLTKGAVHSFEPNPGTFAILSANAALNKLPQIHLHPQGLSDVPGEMTLTFDADNLGTASAYKTVGAHHVKAQLRTLDECCETEKIGKVNLIKADIEGGEMKFLQGAKETFARNRAMMLVVEIAEENCVRAGYTGQELYSFIMAMGFKGFIPRSWPFGLKPIEALPENYHDNIIFIRS